MYPPVYLFKGKNAKTAVIYSSGPVKLLLIIHSLLLYIQHSPIIITMSHYRITYIIIRRTHHELVLAQQQRFIVFQCRNAGRRLTRRRMVCRIERARRIPY